MKCKNEREISGAGGGGGGGKNGNERENMQWEIGRQKECDDVMNRRREGVVSEPFDGIMKRDLNENILS